VDPKIGDSVIVDARQVAQSVFNAMEEFAWFTAISAIDCCDSVLARGSKFASPADADLVRHQEYWSCHN
jgi:hypothetical protein